MNFMLLVARAISHSFAALTREILFLPLEHKIHIFSPPCNILYIFGASFVIFGAFFIMFGASLYSVQTLFGASLYSVLSSSYSMLSSL